VEKADKHANPFEERDAIHGSPGIPLLVPTVAMKNAACICTTIEPAEDQVKSTAGHEPEMRRALGKASRLDATDVAVREGQSMFVT